MENLRLGADETTTEEILESAKMSMAHDFINEFPLRYETALDENGLNLSGGQRQRIAIARAFLKKPNILILDEATSNLDTITEKAIEETLQKHTSGTTTIVIAHRLSTIKRCDNIFVLDKGQVVEMGTHDELVKIGGYYSRLVKEQV